jgi:hypothetical protein
MAQLWAITCKSCGVEVGLEEYGGGGRVVQWHKPEKIKCPNQACGKEHHYSGEDFHLAEGEPPLV